ncbi:hypothetical protein MTQ12_14690 [Brevibacterium sp. R8603A2]|nr:MULTISPECIES: hypothetical protein [Bacteria]MCK1804268.1 hypothetical protein [Brevibacterium sp. R8603A2]MCW6190287.1 hypothetical protein [Klebsiella pneumoniae]
MLMLNCPCGHVISADDEDTLVGDTQEHLARDHPQLKYTREQILFFTDG